MTELFSHWAGSLQLSRISTLFGAGMILALAGCHPTVTDPKSPDFIVAEADGGIVLKRADLDKELDGLLKDNNATREKLGARLPMIEWNVLDHMLVTKLLMDRAKTLGITDTSKEEADQLNQIRERASAEKKSPTALEDVLKEKGHTLDWLKERIHESVVIQKVLDKDAFQNSTPSEKEIQDFYSENASHYKMPGTKRASRILVMLTDKATPAEKATAQKKINAAYARVKKGEDFSKVAQAVSEDTYTAPRGGDMDAFRSGENEPGFDEAISTLKKGDISPVFQTGLGLQFVKITDIIAEGPVPLAKVRDDISARLNDRNKRKQLEIYHKKVLDDAHVRYHITKPDESAAAMAAAQQAPSQQGAPQQEQEAPPQQAPPAQVPQAPEPVTTSTPAPPAK